MQVCGGEGRGSGSGDLGLGRCQVPREERLRLIAGKWDSGGKMFGGHLCLEHLSAHTSQAAHGKASLHSLNPPLPSTGTPLVTRFQDLSQFKSSLGTTLPQRGLFYSRTTFPLAIFQKCGLGALFLCWRRGKVIQEKG